MARKKKTLVLGASDNPERYSNLAIQLLKNAGHPVVGIGRKKCSIYGIPVETDQPPYSGIDTITLYLSPAHQHPYYAYILSLHPKRVIFNPGTENKALLALLEKNGIACIEACTLVMLQTNQF